MNIQTILHKKAGQLIPVELLQKILAQKPTGFGFCVQNVEADGRPDLSITREEECPTLEALAEFQQNAKDWPVIMYFGLLKGQHHADDVQPFLIRDGDDNVFMSFMLEGDFPKFSDPASGHTDEYNLATKIIIPQLEELCELTEGDLDKISASLQRDSFKNTFDAHIGHRGVLTIMPLYGEVITLGKNEIGETADWGSSSQKDGFYGLKTEEPKKVEAAPAAPAKTSFWKSKKAAPVQDAATPGTEPRTSVPTVNNSTADPDKVLTKDAKKTPIRPPSFVHSNNDLKAWYQAMTGAVPANWKKRVPVIVDAAPVIKDLKDLRARMEIKTETAVGKAPEVETKTEKVAATGGDVPIIAGKDLEKVLDFVAKHLDGQSNEMIDPKKIQSIEAKVGTLSSSLGIKPQEILNWPVSGIFALAKEDSRAVAMLAIEMRNLWRSTLKLEDLVGTAKEKEEVTTTTEKLGDDTVKTESVVTAKKGFWKKKAA